MGFVLRDGLSFCRIDDRLLFLDVAADRYFCLPPDPERRLVAILSDAAGDHGDALACLERLGIGRHVPGNAKPAPCKARSPALAFQPMMHRRAAKVPFGARLDMCAALLWARVRIRYFSIDRILKALAHRKIGMELRPRDAALATPVVDAFDAARRLSAADGDCLTRSLCLALSLLDSDVPATLVFGVKLDPFSAHCWVQIGPLLVHDTLDTVGAYTPILAI
jgi:hypothetical protein